MRFIGKLVVPAGGNVNNHTTAVPFDLPVHAKRLFLESDTDGVHFRINEGTGANFDTIAATEDDAQLYDGYDAHVAEGPFSMPEDPTVARIALYQRGGGAIVRVSVEE